MPLNGNKPFPKRPRLKDFEYLGTNAYFITILTKERKDFFVNAQIVNPLTCFLRETSEIEQFAIEIFCFMPDHLHLLIRGLNESSDLKNMIKNFKQKSGFWFKQNNNNNLWHLSYYDHILRKDEAIKDVASYILNNPVRKGIVSDYREYPFSGSFVVDITAIL